MIDHIPARKVMSMNEAMSQQVMGSNPGNTKIREKIILLWTLYTIQVRVVYCINSRI